MKKKNFKVNKVYNDKDIDNLVKLNNKNSKKSGEKLFLEELGHFLIRSYCNFLLLKLKTSEYETMLASFVLVNGDDEGIQFKCLYSIY